jgi:hypothetical protein
VIRRLLLLSVLAQGCDGTGPDPLTVDVRAERSFGLPVPLSFVSRAPRLTLAGTIDVNEPCYDFDASLTTLRDMLVVRLRAERRPTPCTLDPARYSYTLTIDGLEPGTQALRVVYDRRGPPTYTEVAFDGAVEIR